MCFFNLSTKFSKKRQVLPKSDKMERARWKKIIESKGGVL